MDGARLVWALLILLAYGLLCLWSYRHLLRERLRGGDDLTQPGGPFVLVAYASQSGTAADLARRSAAMLQAYMPVRLMPLNQVDDGVLCGASQALFVASTYGEGEPPDNGLAFQRRYLSAAASLDLSHLEFAVLALGDRTYRHFCEFGRRIQAGMERLGASPLGELLEAASDELWAPEGQVTRWRKLLGDLLPKPVADAFTGHQHDGGDASGFSMWCLRSRRHLNPGSLGAPLLDLWLVPEGTLPTWQAGDIAVIVPRNGRGRCREVCRALGQDSGTLVKLNGMTRPLGEWLAERQLPGDVPGVAASELAAWVGSLALLPEREYSIASVPEEGAVRLLIRQQRDPEGRLGLGSGWLTAVAECGDMMRLRIRDNPAFQVPEQDRPLILIGNGSGLAGLRAHLRARELEKAPGRNWLLFGERSRASDSLWNEELMHWLDTGHLDRLDRVFSRDGDPLRYVQDALRAATETLCHWIDDGAIICVCGSQEGMGAGVQAALEDCLGTERLDELKIAGRYRRDLY